MEPLFDIPKFENMYHVPNPNELPFIPPNDIHKATHRPVGRNLKDFSICCDENMVLTDTNGGSVSLCR